MSVLKTLPDENGVSTERTNQHLSSCTSRLLHKIDTHKARVGVVGLGYVGLPLAVSFARQGFSTQGIDLNEDRVKRLNEGYSYIQDVPNESLKEVVDQGLFRAELEYDSIGEADVIFVCVPTPVTQHKDPDIQFIESATKAIARHLRAGQLIVLKSTTFPNTTQQIVQPILEEAAATRSLQLGKEYFLAFSPERVDPGNQTYTTENTPVVVGGVTGACTEVAAKSLEKIVTHVHRVSSPKVAEMEKLLENIFRSVNIALVNELARLCDRMGGISIWEVVEAAATKPFGFMPFYPGPGLGGHCIPIDPYYLSWLARKYDFETSFVTLAARTNEDMPYYVTNCVINAIAGQSVRMDEARVLILGVAFKKDVDDTRHSPAIKVIDILMKWGIEHITYSDPNVPTLSVQTSDEPIRLDSMDLTAEVLEQQHVVVLITNHSDFPYQLISKHARSIVDTRNAFKARGLPRDNVRVLGGGDF